MSWMMRCSFFVLTAFVCVSSAAAQSSTDPLVSALRERLMTAEAVAMSKFNSGAPVEDRTRERAVINGAVHQAVNMGIDADVTVSIFKAQIEASKVAQRAFLQKWQGRPPFPHVPDLAKEIRPKLDRLTSAILHGMLEARYRSEKVLAEGPSDPVYKEAWKIAIRPFRMSK